MPLRPDMEPGDFLDILRRRKWMILFSILLVLFGGILYCVLATDLYRATVKIRIIPPPMAEGIVKPTVNIGTKDRLAMFQQEILSRDRLNAVVDEMGLFKEYRKETSGDGMVDLMRKRITMEMDRTNTLILSADHENPQVAKDLASRLGSFFIEQNNKTRVAATQGTTVFLESQLEETRKKLEAQEDKLKRYKMQYGGELPEQMNANLGRLTRLQDQIKNNTEAITRMEDRKVFIESQISGLGGQNLPVRPHGVNTPAGRKASATPYDPAQSLLGELGLRKKKLSDLQAKFTPLHPSVVLARTQVEQMEARIALLRQTGGSAPPSGTGYPDAEGDGQSTEVRRLRDQIVAIDFEIAAKKREIAATNRTIDTIQSKVERLPQREQEMISLTRDYGNIKNSYEELLKKKLQSSISEKLEEKQQEDQFLVIEPAALPVKPIKPDRLKILMIALMASIVIGAGGAVALEVLNPKLRGAKDFKGFFDLPILACLPVIENAEYRRRIAVRRAAVIGGLVSIAGAYLVLLAIHGAKVKSILLSIGQGFGGGN